MISIWIWIGRPSHPLWFRILLQAKCAIPSFVKVKSNSFPIARMRWPDKQLTYLKFDKYFEELKSGLENEKEKLEEEAREVLEEKEPTKITKAIKTQPHKQEKSQNEEEDYWNEIF